MLPVELEESMMTHDDEETKDADTDVSKHVDDAFEAEYEDDEEDGTHPKAEGEDEWE